MEAFENKINTIDDKFNKSLSIKYFNNFDKISKLLERYNNPLSLPLGNYSPRIVYIYNYGQEDDKLLNFIRDIYKSNNADFFALYITPIKKFNITRNENIDILKKEISILKPKKIIVLGDVIDFKGDAICLSESDLNEIKRCINDIELKKNNDRFTKARTNFIKCIKFALR